MRVQKLTVWMSGLKKKKISKNHYPHCQGAHVPVQSQNTTEAKKLRRPDTQGAPTCFSVSGSSPHWTQCLQHGLLQGLGHKWGHWTPKRLEPLPDCPKPPSSLYTPLTSLPTGKNIFTPITNQANVLAPFKFQLKMQARLHIFPAAHSVFPSVLDSDCPCALEPCWTREWLFTHDLGQVFFLRRYCLLIGLQDLSIYSGHFWRNSFIVRELPFV